MLSETIAVCDKLSPVESLILPLGLNRFVSSNRCLVAIYNGRLLTPLVTQQHFIFRMEDFFASVLVKMGSSFFSGTIPWETEDLFKSIVAACEHHDSVKSHSTPTTRG